MNVPNGFEDRSAYRIAKLVFNSICIFGKICHSFHISNQPILLRRIFDSFNPAPQFDEKDNLIVTNELFDQVPVRIYKPKQVTNNLPALIFYHGGGYVFGSIDSYDEFTYVLAKKLNIIVISIGYKLAPENAHPIPLDDCWIATKYIAENANSLSIDDNQIILLGDSAGGSAVLNVITRFLNTNKKQPILQVLIYPWLQHVNLQLPSYNKYRKKSCYALDGIRCILWYLGVYRINQQMYKAIKQNEHYTLIEDTDLRLKYASYLNVDLIPDEYKKNKNYYVNYKKLQDSSLMTAKLSDRSILKRNKEFALKALQLFDTSLSPALLDDEIIKKLPETYMIICECDEFKDENLIFAQRLRNNGVSISVSFCEDGYHGMITDISKGYLNRNSIKLVDDMVQFIKSKIVI